MRCSLYFICISSTSLKNCCVTLRVLGLVFLQVLLDSIILSNAWVGCVHVYTCTCSIIQNIHTMYILYLHVYTMKIVQLAYLILALLLVFPSLGQSVSCSYLDVYMVIEHSLGHVNLCNSNYKLIITSRVCFASFYPDWQ